MSAPAVRRFLIDEIERLESRCSDLLPYVDKYNDLRVDKAVLESRLKSSKLNDVMSAVCLTAGSAALGASSKLIGADMVTGVIVLAVGFVLLTAGIIAKVWKWT